MIREDSFREGTDIWMDSLAKERRELSRGNRGRIRQATYDFLVSRDMKVSRFRITETPLRVRHRGSCRIGQFRRRYALTHCSYLSYLSPICIMSPRASEATAITVSAVVMATMTTNAQPMFPNRNASRAAST